jgi:hypothetical protein
MEADMLREILLAGAATLLLSAPALAIGPASVPAPSPTSSASQCDNCSAQDQDDTSGSQSQTAPAGSGVTGPVSNPSKPEPAHTEVPSHASGAGPGGSPKG